MNRYEVKVRIDKTFIVEAESRKDAERVALEDDECFCPFHALTTRSVVGIKDLTSDPYELLVELAMRLEAASYRNNCCKFCGMPHPASHSADCIIERARHCIREHDEKLDNLEEAINELDRELRRGGFGDCHCCGSPCSKGHTSDCPLTRLSNYVNERKQDEDHTD